MAITKREKLFTEFPPVPTEKWEEVITADLKGADYERKLVWRTGEGFNVRPYYRAENLEGIRFLGSQAGEFPFVRGTRTHNRWHVHQTVEVKSPREANAEALKLLNSGVDSLGFSIVKEGFTAADLDELLREISIPAVELTFCGVQTGSVAGLMLDKLEKEGLMADAHVAFCIDPLVKGLSQKGDFCSPNGEKCFAKIVSLIERTREYKHIRIVTVSAGIFSNAGSTIVEELAFALSAGNDYIARLTDAGVDAELAARKLRFSFAVTSNYFLEIAKFRAGRMLWANIVNEYKPECECACKMIAHAETSTFNLTLFDAHVNLLRTQTETMSAALAGVNSITVTPFDKTYKTPDDFSERIARNQQLLLKEECHFNKVVDPAAGSYFIENLTVSIAKQAWDLFLNVEEEGGMLEAVKAGKVQEAVNASNKARHDAVSKRKEVLLGTNQFPNFNEKAGEKNPVEAQCCCSGNSCEKPIATLNFNRAASEFEALRLQTERSGKRPKAFMLTIGNLAMRQARAQFSCNFLACAGYEVIDNLGFPTVEEGVEAAMKAGADIVVICSSDDEYAEYAVPAFKALNGRAMFIVAGAPACMEDLKAAGIENFIHVRVNVLETLKEYNAKLGIK